MRTWFDSRSPAKKTIRKERGDLSTIELALGLAKKGFHVFPVEHHPDNSKRPLTKNGHLDATTDLEQVKAWWAKHPDALPGVSVGPSGIVVADIDTKNDKDGWDSLSQAWLSIPETFSYDTSTGGTHLVYEAPAGVTLNGQSNYRGMEGVDRRGGSSWVMWVGPVPERSDITPAPGWLCDEATARTTHQFEGTLKEWYDNLTPGEPNALVRRAWERAEERFKSNGNDLSHSDLVEMQYEAVRLGAEGNSGIPQFLDFLEELFLSRTGEHTRDPQDWPHEWAEALHSGVEKYGDLIDQLKNLPKYSIGIVPKNVPDSLVTNPSGTAGYSRLLGALIKETDNDDLIASILWNCPATIEVSRDWGLEFTYKRIADARVKPEPIRENPRIEERREAVQEGKSESLTLLTSEEREIADQHPTFVDNVLGVSRGYGYDQDPYFRSIAWTTAGMAFAFKGFVPMSKTHKMGLNLWFINLGESGTGKSVSGGFRDGILKCIFEGDNPEGAPYDLGDDSSPQGLHLALLERDKKASLFSSDEAAGFFSTLGLRDWKTGIDERITSWYNGFVQGTQKMTLKEMRGKTALTSFFMHLFGTPNKVTKVVETEMFETGFMARVNWVFGNPPRRDDSRFQLRIDEDVEDGELDEVPSELRSLATDLITATAHLDKSVAILPGGDVMDRLSAAYKFMYTQAEGHVHWEILEPSITRLAETLIKCAAISTMYRGDDEIQMIDVLHAIRGVEEWYQNLFQVADMVSSGEFARRCDELEAYLRQEGGKASGAKIYHRFKGWIVRDSKEIENVITYLIQSGIINRIETDGNLRYELNGD